MTADIFAPVAGVAALTVYLGARLGLWAPRSHASLRALMGDPGALERLALVVATAAGAIYVLNQVVKAT